jgi:DNA-binding NarL/FixJ family response regulator
MCGITDMMSIRAAAFALPDDLRRPGYRSYDNTGSALHLNLHLDRDRAQGKCASLVDTFEREPLSDLIGFAVVHSRLEPCARPAAERQEIATDNTEPSRPDPSQQSASRRAAVRSRSSIKTAIRPGRLIVLERRAFVRGCLSCWLGKYFQDLETVSAADVEVTLDPDALARTAAVIIGVNTLEQSDRWLHRQVAWLRAKQPALPIMVIVEAEEIGAATDLGEQLDLQGYIPSFSSLEVAAAAVRLVVAGGNYFPRPREHEPQLEEALPGRTYRTLDLAEIAELTSREWAVVGLLGSGVPNKDIGDRLGMSLSTVKAHVHHIIRKLNVRNRTEVALLSLFLQPGANGTMNNEFRTDIPMLPRPRRQTENTNDI